MKQAASPNKKVVVIKRLILVMVGIAVLVGLGYGLKKLFSGQAPAKKPVTTIKLLPDTPPPPPPPPPPPKEQPKEQPKEIKQEVKQEAPQPPSEALKMEGAAGDGPSPFTAGAVTNDYKGGEAETGKIGGKSNARFNWFSASIKRQIEEALAKDKTLASGKYSVVVHVWVEADGRFKRCELAGSSGDPETDSRIKAALSSMPPLADSPPDDMPQPVKLRVTARSAG